MNFGRGIAHLTLIIAVSSMGGAAKPPPRQQVANYSMEIAGVTLTVTLPRRNKIGAPINTHIALINRGKEQVEYYPGPPVFHLRMMIEGQDLPRKQSDGSVPQDSFAELEPGQTIAGDYDLQKVFGLEKPGTYRLTVLRSINEGGGDDWDILEVADIPVYVGEVRSPFLTDD